MTDPNSFHSNAFLGVHGGKLIYVLVSDRAAFDAIALPVSDDGRVLVKAMHPAIDAPVGVPRVDIIFQFWRDGSDIAAGPAR